MLKSHRASQGDSTDNPGVVQIVAVGLRLVAGTARSRHRFHTAHRRRAPPHPSPVAEPAPPRAGPAPPVGGTGPVVAYPAQPGAPARRVAPTVASASTTKTFTGTVSAASGLAKRLAPAGWVRIVV